MAILDFARRMIIRDTLRDPAAVRRILSNQTQVQMMLKYIDITCLRQGYLRGRCHALRGRRDLCRFVLTVLMDIRGVTGCTADPATAVVEIAYNPRLSSPGTTLGMALEVLHRHYSQGSRAAQDKTSDPD